MSTTPGLEIVCWDLWLNQIETIPLFWTTTSIPLLLKTCNSNKTQLPINQLHNHAGPILVEKTNALP